MKYMSARTHRAVAVLVTSPEGIPLVMDLSKPKPHCWKLPGGTGKYDETPEDIGKREMEEETGVIIPEDAAQDVYEEPRKGHIFHLIRAELPFLKGVKQLGDDGEIVKIFSKEAIQNLTDFMPSHRRVLEYIGFF